MAWRPGVFFQYAALTFGAFVFARSLVPETKGLSLEEVEALWVACASGRKGAIVAKPTIGKWRPGKMPGACIPKGMHVAAETRVANGITSEEFI